MSSSNLPMLPGLPIVGSIFEFRKNPVEVLDRGRERFGMLFGINLGLMKAAVLLGPENHRFFFRETDRVLSISSVYRLMTPIFGQGFLLATEGGEYRLQRQLLQPVFQPDKMGAFVRAAVDESAGWLATLGGEGEFELVEAMERLAVRVMAQGLMGREFHAAMGPDFEELYFDLVRGIDFLLPSWLPLRRFRRRDRARRMLQQRIRALLLRRRSRPGGNDDYLQSLAEARGPDGQFVPVEVLESMVLFLVFSGSESTPLQTCWALILLLQHPAYCHRVLQEQAAALPAGAGRLTAADLDRLVLFEWALKESERLRPMTTMLWRKTVATYTLGDHSIPKGWITMICPAVSHRLPDVFAEPNRYDPDRFGPARAEDLRTPFSLVGFGGGTHRCPGHQLAYAFMKTVLSMLLESYACVLSVPEPRPDYRTFIGRPPAPCLVKYVRRSGRASPCPGHRLPVRTC